MAVARSLSWTHKLDQGMCEQIIQTDYVNWIKQFINKICINKMICSQIGHLYFTH